MVIGEQNWSQELIKCTLMTYHFVCSEPYAMLVLQDEGKKQYSFAYTTSES